MTPKPALDLEAIARRVGIRTDLNPGIDGMIPLTPNERDALITALRTKEAALQEAVGALEQWRCGSCNDGVYVNRSRNRGREVVACKICGGTGMNPIARSALTRIKEKTT